MDEKDKQELIFKLGSVIMMNEKREAEAVEGYNEQLKVITLAREAYAGDPDFLAYLDKIEAATAEKISDELNHGESLYKEYAELTGIQPAED